MEIEIVGYEEKAEVKFEDLAPGTVFEDPGGAKMLKLEGSGYIALVYSTGQDWFSRGDGSMAGPEHEVSKVLGKLVGIKIQP